MTCRHVLTRKPVAPRFAGCEECRRTGGTWVRETWGFCSTDQVTFELPAPFLPLLRT